MTISQNKCLDLLVFIFAVIFLSSSSTVFAADAMPTFTEDDFAGCQFAPELGFNHDYATAVSFDNMTYSDVYFGEQSNTKNRLHFNITYYRSADTASAEFQKTKNNYLNSLDFYKSGGTDGRIRLISEEDTGDAVGLLVYAPIVNTDFFLYLGQYWLIYDQNYFAWFELSGPIDTMTEEQAKSNYSLAKECLQTVLNKKDRKLQGIVTNAWGEFLPFMVVKLSYNGKEYETTTGEDGTYQFPFADTFGKVAKLTLVMQCRDDQTTYFTILYDVKTYTPHTVVHEFTIQNDNDLKHDVKVEDKKTGTEYLGDIYRDMTMAIAFYVEVLKVQPEPCSIRPYSFGKTLYVPLDLGIQISDSDTEYKEYSERRSSYVEYHEYAHHIMYCMYGKKFPAPPADAMPKEINHGGYINPSTSDSLVEGFADFMGSAIRKFYAEKSQSVPFTSDAREINERAWDSHGYAEEDAVSGLLWDLHDGINPLDGDNIQLTIEEIWAVLKTYRANMYEVYTGFIETYPERKAEIQQVFINHGFFADKNEGNKQYDFGEPTRGQPELNGFVDLANPIQRDIGETIGQATNYQRPERYSQEPWPNYFIKTGTTYPFYKIRFTFTGHSYLNYDLYQEQRDGLIFVPVPADNYEAQVSIEGYGEGVSTGSPLNFTNKEFIESYQTIIEQGYYREHDFQITGPALTRPQTDPQRADPESNQCIAGSVLGFDDPRLDTLRKLRDQVLSKSAAGKKIINTYYTGSAKIIPVLDRHPNIKKAAKALLVGMIPVVEVLIK